MNLRRMGGGSHDHSIGSIEIDYDEAVTSSGAGSPPAVK